MLLPMLVRWPPPIELLRLNASVACWGVCALIFEIDERFASSNGGWSLMLSQEGITVSKSDHVDKTTIFFVGRVNLMQATTPSIVEDSSFFESGIIVMGYFPQWRNSADLSMCNKM
jgi:hypothetical protein